MNPLRQVAAVAGALLVLLCTAAPARADDIRNGQWHLTSLHVGEAQKLSTGGGVIVGVVDTGVNADHVDLARNVLPGVDLTTAKGGNGWTDLVGHGTGMASLIAAHGHGAGAGALGIAPAAKILPVRAVIRNLHGVGGAVEQGIQWAADHGARVVNVSIDAANTPALRRAVDYALGKDVVVVAGVGLPGGLGGVAAPARLPGVLAVSGVDRAGNLAVSASGPEVAIAAPAKEIPHATKGGGYSLGTGTSDSTAIVSGVVALIRAKYPGLNAANVINRLISTANDKGPPGRDEGYGFGIVNPVRALTADVPKVDRNPLLLAAPSSAAQNSAPKARSSSSPAPRAAPASDGPPWIWLGIGPAVLIVAAAAIWLLLRRSRPNVGAGWQP
jgi:type VII secretion-associated serine protease mycosin